MFFRLIYIACSLLLAWYPQYIDAKADSLRQKMYWEVVAAPVNEALKIAGQDSSGTVWVYELDEWLLTYQADTKNWQRYRLPWLAKNGHTIQLIADVGFMAFVIDQDYKTHFYVAKYPLRQNDLLQWQKLELVAPYPVRNALKKKDGEVVVYGDFGLMYEFKDDALHPIAFPYEAHITTATELEGKVVAAVRGHGVVILDRNGKWVTYPLEQQLSEDLLALYINTDKQLYASSISGSLYRLKGGEMRLVGQIPYGPQRYRSFFYNNNSYYMSSISGLGILDQQAKVRWINPAGTSIITDGHIYKDSLLMLSTKEGELLLPKKAGVLRFQQSFSHPGLTQSEWNALQLHIADFNQDGFEDIFLNQKHPLYPHKLMTKSKDRFLDQFSVYMQQVNQNIHSLVLHDFNQDGKQDLAVMSQYGQQYILHIYLWAFKAFQKVQEMAFYPQKGQNVTSLELFKAHEQSAGDLIFGYYYNGNRDKGTMVHLENNGWGYFKESNFFDTDSLAGWYSTTLVEDIDGDGMDDVLLGQYWKPDQLLLSSQQYATQQAYNDSLWTNTLSFQSFYRDTTYVLFKEGADHRISAYYFDPKTARFTSYKEPFITERSFKNGWLLTDINSDGYIDFVYGTEVEKAIQLNWLKGSKEGFRAKEILVEANQVGLTSINQIRVLDWDKDTDQDLLLTDAKHLILLENHQSLRASGSLSPELALPKSVRRAFVILGVLISQHTAQYIAALIAIFMLGSIGQVRYAKKRFGWNKQSRLIILGSNAFLFGLALWIHHSTSSIWAQAMPYIVLSGNMFIPLVISQQLGKKRREDVRLELLSMLLAFRHGEMAKSLINRMILLSKNASQMQVGVQRGALMDRLEENREYFYRMVYADLERIAAISLQSGVELSTIETFKKELKGLKKRGNKALATESFGQHLQNLSETLRAIKTQCWQWYSTDVGKEAAFIVSVKEKTSNESIRFSVHSSCEPTQHVLLPADVLNNALQHIIENAVRALDGFEGAEIHLQIRYKEPKVVIEISNNGPSIPAKIAESMFENGVSGYGSTGLGLYLVRKSLQKFGGHIYHEQRDKLTCFILELQEA